MAQFELEKPFLKKLIPPADIAGFSLALLPIFNFLLFVMNDTSGILGKYAEISYNAKLFLAIILVLIISGNLLYNTNHLLGKLLIILACCGASTLFLMGKTQDHFVQLLVLSSCMFVVLYLIGFPEKKTHLRPKSFNFIIMHQFIFICFLLLGCRDHFNHYIWTRYSMMVYAILLSLISYGLIRNTHISKRSSYLYPQILLIITLLIIISEFIYPVITLPVYFLIIFLWLYHFLKLNGFSDICIDMLFENPLKLMIFSFALIILIGSILLYMPVSATGGKQISFIDSLFTATSATCVTGLAVLDTGRDFSFFGQLVILALIQIGGIGIITIMTFISIAVGRSLGLQREFIVSEIIGSQRPKFVYKIVKFIIIATLTVELTGAIILTVSFYFNKLSPALGIWHGVFHSVSAYCNAGFSLATDSLVSYNHQPVLLMTVGALIVIGGLGFATLVFMQDIITRQHIYRGIPLHVKITLCVSLGLIILGYVFTLMFEYDTSLDGLSFLNKNTNALFLSITSRTAGFNSVKMSSLTNPTQMLLWFLMFVGGGTCSTAGGIKVTTFGVLIALFYSCFRGSERVTCFHRELPARLVYSAIFLTAISLTLVFIAAILLQFNPEISIRESIFECFSALGTVGLTVGATEKLRSFDKVIIILLMYVGRLGPMTFITLAGITLFSERQKHVKYPEENLMIG